MCGIATRREGVRLRVGRDGDGWHRQSRTLPQAVDDVVELGGLVARHDLRPVRT
jgi:hypothetical protein